MQPSIVYPLTFAGLIGLGLSGLDNPSNDEATVVADKASPRLTADLERPSTQLERRSQQARNAHAALQSALAEPELDDGRQFATDIERINYERAKRLGVEVKPAKRYNYPHAPNGVRKVTLRTALEDLELYRHAPNPVRTMTFRELLEPLEVIIDEARSCDLKHARRWHEQRDETPREASEKITVLRK